MCGNHATVAIHLADEIAVVCPESGAAAWSRPRGSARRNGFAPRRVACGDWGFARDPHFGLPLWLQALWAYGAAHLEFIADFAGGRRRDPVLGWANRALESRLPRWIKLARHRAEVLKGVERLRRRLAEAGAAAE